MKTLLMLFATLWLANAGCANTKAATAATAHGAIDAACTIAHKGVDLALGPIADAQADATAVIDAAKGLVK